MNAPIKSLADLQAERDGLRAVRAKASYEEALAATCAAEEVQRAGRVVRAAWNSGLDRLVDWMANAIDRENDETRIHFNLSDVAHDFLAQMGAEARTLCAAVPEMGEAIDAGMKPRDLLTVSQWADKYRFLKTGTNLPGPWSTANNPHLQEIMDSLSEHSPVEEVVFVKSVQVGGTEVLYNWIGYIMHHLRNKDMMVVVPSLELRDRSFNSRLSRMFEETPALTELVKIDSRNRANREDLLEYGIGARMIKSGANSSKSLRSDPIAYVICDEVDEFPEEIAGSGDPMTLIEGRQTTFSRAKTFMVSTPKLDASSRIWAKWKRSDMRLRYVPCPHCGEYQPLEFGDPDTPYGLKFTQDRHADDEAIPEHERLPRVRDVWYECAHCHQRIHEGHKPAMFSAARWVPQRPSVKKRRGYHLNALYAPLGLGKSWQWLAEKWLSCQGNSSELQAFVNERLGLPWSEQGDSIDDISIITRLETYPDPLPIVFVTAGVDVQKDRLEVTIDGWAPGEECWTITHSILPGDTALPEVWEALNVELTTYEVDAAAIDSGYNTSMVYAFVEKRRWCYAIKGMDGLGRPLVEDALKRKQRLRRRRKRGVPVEPIGVDQGKALLYSRLKLPKTGQGYVHYPSDPVFDDEYFAQLGAEKLVVKSKGGRTYQEWVKTRTRNEALDCKVYSLAALRLAGVDLAVLAEQARERKERDQVNKPSARRVRARFGG